MIPPANLLRAIFIYLKSDTINPIMMKFNKLLYNIPVYQISTEIENSYGNGFKKTGQNIYY